MTKWWMSQNVTWVFSIKVFWKVLKPVIYRKYVNDILALSKKDEDLKLDLNYLNLCHEKNKFTSKNKQTTNYLFLILKCCITRKKSVYHFSFLENPNLSEYIRIFIVLFMLEIQFIIELIFFPSILFFRYVVTS